MQSDEDPSSSQWYGFSDAVMLSKTFLVRPTSVLKHGLILFENSSPESLLNTVWFSLKTAARSSPLSENHSLTLQKHRLITPLLSENHSLSRSLFLFNPLSFVFSQSPRLLSLTTMMEDLSEKSPLLWSFSSLLYAKKSFLSFTVQLPLPSRESFPSPWSRWLYQYGKTTHQPGEPQSSTSVKHHQDSLSWT